jgi:hypothetical protein
MGLFLHFPVQLPLFLASQRSWFSFDSEPENYCGWSRKLAFGGFAKITSPTLSRVIWLRLVISMIDGNCHRRDSNGFVFAFCLESRRSSVGSFMQFRRAKNPDGSPLNSELKYSRL